MLFKIYQILTTEFSILDAFKTSLVVFSVQIFGFIIELILTNTINNSYKSPELYLFPLSLLSTIFLILLFRISIRTVFTFANLRGVNNNDKTNTLIIGAGSVAKILFDDSIGYKKNKYKFVGLIDDDKKKIGKLFYGVKIYGPITNIKRMVEELKVETVIIAISNISKERLKEILNLLKDSPVRIKRAPLLSELQGPFDIKTMDVDINELLGRKIIELNNDKIISELNNKIVMVTGAGGSIGSELSKQIFRCKPKTLILFDIYENGVYEIQTTLMQQIRKEYITNFELIVLIGSTYNYKRMESIIRKYKPDFIYHAAAYKHVPLMEDSPQEALRTNFIGTYNVAKLADKYKVKKMILVSTDKAVRPTNVMGATKKAAEEIIKYFGDRSKNTCYSAVRFGNVLNSNGSVIPLFKKQIADMGPVTITDKRIIRYFMTIKEAVSLIIQCGLYANKGEIFILDMGSPVKILNLAEMMIRQAGYKPYQDINIIEIGLRPGEKLYEELLVDKSKHKHVANNLIFVEQKTPSTFSENLIEKVKSVIEEKDPQKIKECLKEIVKSYTYKNETN